MHLLAQLAQLTVLDHVIRTVIRDYYEESQLSEVPVPKWKLRPATPFRLKAVTSSGLARGDSLSSRGEVRVA